MKKRTGLLFILTFIVTLTIGCTQLSRNGDMPVPPQQGEAPALAPEESPAPPPEETGSGIWLEVTQPSDGIILDNKVVEVKGHTKSGAVVSINGEFTNVDEEGNFALSIDLEEGPNIIEVISSDSYGNEARASLIITYITGG